MAVSVGDLALDLRIIAEGTAAVPAGQSEILTRLLAAAEAMVAERTSGAPVALADAAVLSIAAYLYDRPTAGGGSRYASAWRNSGASEILSAYILRRAVVIGAGAGDGPNQSGGIPGPAVDAAAVNALIAAYLAANPQGVTQADIEAAVTEYLIANPPSGDSYSDARARAAAREIVLDWAEVGNDTAMPADKHRLATTTARGAVAAAGSNAVVDNETGPGLIRGWSLTHLIRLIVRKVAPWSLAESAELIPVDKLPLASTLDQPITLVDSIPAVADMLPQAFYSEREEGSATEVVYRHNWYGNRIRFVTVDVSKAGSATGNVHLGMAEDGGAVAGQLEGVDGHPEFLWPHPRGYDPADPSNTSTIIAFFLSGPGTFGQTRQVGAKMTLVMREHPDDQTGRKAIRIRQVAEPHHDNPPKTVEFLLDFVADAEGKIGGTIACYTLIAGEDLVLPGSRQVNEADARAFVYDDGLNVANALSSARSEGYAIAVGDIYELEVFNPPELYATSAPGDAFLRNRLGLTGLPAQDDPNVRAFLEYWDAYGADRPAADGLGERLQLLDGDDQIVHVGDELAAQNTAAAALSNISRILERRPAGGGGSIVAGVEDGRLPADPVAMRLGWSQSRVFAAGTFTRAEDHPIDGAVEGTSDGLILPPFPPALATDETLYLGIWIAGDPSVVGIDRTSWLGGEDSLAFFPAADRVALTVDLVDGFYYPNTAREAPPIEGQDDVLSVTLGGGPLIITEDNIGDHAVGGADAVARAQAAAAHAASDAATAAAGAAAAEAEAAQDTADAAGVAATAATEAAATADGKAVAADGKAVAAQGTADTAEAAAAVNAAAIAALPEGGGGGTPVEVETESLRHTRSTLLYETDSTAFTDAVWVDIYEVDGATQIVCPDNGEIEVYAYAKSGLRDDSVAYARFPAADLRLSPTDGPKHIPLGANRWFGIQVNNLADARIQLKGQDGQDSVNGNYAIRISHITEHTSEVVTAVSGTVGGRTEIFSGAVTYAEQEFDLALEDGDAGKMLRLEMWRQGASDPPELRVLYQVSCSVDNWLRSLGGAPSSSAGVLIAGWGDEDESSERNWIRVRPGDTIAKRKTHFRFGSALRNQAALPDNAKIWLEG